ncbi:MAG: tRNA pseudouridine(38-40) synthase TruA [Clostridia bacterium]|nr:tRNA pseudouridine(38-40) synthase TruA [Clostridia bacterium]
MERFKLVVQYDGTEFSGFQIQPEKRTIQGELERVLAFLVGEKVRIYASGRTDTGVSAFAQVCHFDTEKEIDAKKLEVSLNGLLPDDVAVLSVEKVSMDFDSRFTAKKKTYQFRFYVSRYELPLLERSAVRINDYADVKMMNEACKFLIGTYDFSSFVAAKSGKTDFVRTIYDAKIVEIGDGIFAFEVTGNGFLYNMVRIIFGTLLKVAYGKMKPEEMKAVIEAKDRKKAGKTMPAKGLLMKSVVYDD